MNVLHHNCSILQGNAKTPNKAIQILLIQSRWKNLYLPLPRAPPVLTLTQHAVP